MRGASSQPVFLLVVYRLLLPCKPLGDEADNHVTDDQLGDEAGLLGALADGGDLLLFDRQRSGHQLFLSRAPPGSAGAALQINPLGAWLDNTLSRAYTFEMCDLAIPKIKKVREVDLWLDIAITGWEWEYSLSTAYLVGADPLSERDSPYVTGDVILKRGGAPLSVKITLVDAPGCQEKVRQGRQFDDVGVVNRITRGFEGAIAVPPNAMTRILMMLAGGHYKQLRLALWKQARRYYRVHSYCFKHDPVTTEAVASPLWEATVFHRASPGAP